MINPLVTVRSLHRWLAGRSGYDQLPRRVQRSIDKQQSDSEILIGWIQLAVLAAFATLYMVAPKPHMGMVSFEPVPWALTIWRWIW